MKDITWHKNSINHKDREKLLRQKGILIWFTGLSGSGKSTLANNVSKKLHDTGKLTYVLDGDNIRHGLNSDLGFTEKDRRENIRRIGEVAQLFVDTGVITLTCFISPYRKDRDALRKKLGDRFIEVHVDCSLEECARRDPKGLYKKAKKGKIKNLTGVDAPYEKPKNPEITLDTCNNTSEENTQKILEYLKKKI
ncbi:MAG: adenylyl-sulfate kinase [Candidatus Altiarchaeota archaeon]|nr:adenylyl-sulfate kinase [Candidatus Altiarchaeota archaeon]